ncbi:MAG: hypothetical protein ACKO13_12995, partial [Cytophagales bacterium]
MSVVQAEKLSFVYGYVGHFDFLGFGVMADFQHKSSMEELHLNLPQNCHTKALNPPLRQTAVISSGSFCHLVYSHSF